MHEACAGRGDRVAEIRANTQQAKDHKGSVGIHKNEAQRSCYLPMEAMDSQLKII